MFLFPRRLRCSFCSCFLILILAFFVGVGYFLAKTDILNWQSVVNFLSQKIKTELWPKIKVKIKKQGKKMENKVYKEAKEHNPKGDVIPDDWDDRVKEKIKSKN